MKQYYQTSIVLDEKTSKQLKAFATKSGFSQSAIIRRLIAQAAKTWAPDEFLKQE